MPGSMNRVPAVSVVLPTHNRAALLKRSVESVLCQSYRDFELIVVDDASTDETREVMNGFIDDRIRFVRLGTNVGGGAARNHGVSQARAPIIAFQDSDDVWLPQKLERCMDILANDKDLAGVFSAFWQIQGRAASYKPSVVPRMDEMSAVILRGNFIDTPTCLVRRGLFQQAGGFDPDMPRYQDWELFIRLLERGAFAFIEEPLVLSYVTPGSISSSSRAHKLAMEKMYEKHQSRIALDAGLNATWLANIGDAQLRAGETGAGRKNLLRSWRVSPLRAGITIRVIVALLGGRVLYGHLSRVIERCR